MKLIKSILGGLVIIGGLIALSGFIHAQVTTAQVQSFLGGAGLPDGQPDSIVQLIADEQGLQLLSPDQIPGFGTFWIVTGEQPAPPYPFLPPQYNLATTPVFSLGPPGQFLVDATGGALPQPTGRQALLDISTLTLLQGQANMVLDLITQIQATQARSGMQAMDESGPPAPGGGGDGGTNTYFGSSYTAPNYGTNLWIANFALSSGNAVGIVSNTLADVSYEIQSKQNLLQSNWISEGFVLSSTATNWMPMSVSLTGRTNSSLFFRVRSWIDSQNVGIPDWWQIFYFGAVGINPYSDPEGDGWTVLQLYIAGLNPTNHYAPPIVQGVYVGSGSSGNDVLNWIRPEVTPSSFTIQENTGSGWQTIATVAGNVSSFTASNPPANSSFQISANYPNGSSAYTSAGSPSNVNPVLTLTATVAAGPNGRLFLLTAKPSTTVTGLVVTASPDPNDDFPKDGIDTVAPQYPYTDFYARNYAVSATLNASALQSPPLEISINFAPIYGWYDFSIQALGTNGITGNAVQSVWWADATPFLDGRQHMLDNLNFALRAASGSQPFDFYFPADLYDSAGTFYGIFQNYTTAGFSWAYGNYDDVLYRSDFSDPFLPFENDSVLRAFCFDTNQFDVYGNPLDVGYDGYFDQLPTMNTWNYYFNALAYVQSGSTNVPARQLNPTTTQYIFYGPANDDNDVADLGMTWDQSIPGWRLNSNLRNVYGLRMLSVICVKASQTPEPLTYYVVSPGGIIPEMGTTNNPGSGWLYVETENPVFQKIGFHFVPEAYASAALTGPGFAEWTGVPNTNSLLASVGNQSFFYLWTQLAVSNANAGTVSYLEDYFDKAYQIDTNGLVTTNQTGVLSEYGDFFPTAPGPVALTTKPDLATGQTCTGIVQVISLALDANDDGTVDPTFYGSDYTSSSKPYVFWVNNNYDRYAPDADDGTNYMDDVQNAGCAYTPNTSTPDCNYRDSYGNRVIPCTRDLEDFARLWVCGVNSNLLAALPPGATVTLSWSSVSGNPTIDLFQAVGPDGSMGYLTNEAVAAQQIDPVYSTYVGRVGPSQNIQLNSSYFSGWAGNHFIWCGVTNGSGALNLTIADAGGNTLAQSTVYIQLVDIKQMYERWTVGDNPPNPPLNVPVLAGEELPQPFYYASQAPAGTPYILFVHGWNMETWEKDRFAETAFKRLYWQGYHGRFGEFRWPTSYGFTGDFSQLITDPQEKDNFDNSEYCAWQSGTGLLNLLTSLNAKYPGQVYVLAHSMGNIVTGEALRLAGNNQVVNTYVASQAAVTAHTYDETVPNYSFNVTIGGIQFNFGPKTPNIYGDWFTGDNGGGAGKAVSFFNANDYALSQLHWQLDQLFKPDILVAENGALWNYEYSGGTNDPPPWNNFFKTNDVTSARVNFDIVNSLANRYEVMSYAAQAYTTALGATPVVHNVAANVNLTTLWPSPDPLNNNYASHFFHSAEFRGDTVWEWNYWNTLLYSRASGFNLSQ